MACWWSMSCFTTQYFLAFAILAIFTYFVCFLNAIIMLAGTLLVLASISWKATKYIRRHYNKNFISSLGKAVLITGILYVHM
jgi:hypothetical protein